MLGLALCLWPLADAGAARIVARIGSVGAITNSGANLLEDFFRLRLFGSGFVVSALVIVIALVALAVLLLRSRRARLWRGGGTHAARPRLRRGGGPLWSGRPGWPSHSGGRPSCERSA